jgi:hypothetical protein
LIELFSDTPPLRNRQLAELACSGHDGQDTDLRRENIGTSPLTAVERSKFDVRDLHPGFVCRRARAATTALLLGKPSKRVFEFPILLDARDHDESDKRGHS